LLPAIIAGAGDRASLRFLEYFTVNIRNKNTWAAYARAAADFLNWREGLGIEALGRVQPMHVAGYVELLQGTRSAPTVKQHLACIRTLFDWLVIGQVTARERKDCRYEEDFFEEWSKGVKAFQNQLV
jgi:site-specific recombinase XerD